MAWYRPPLIKQGDGSTYQWLNCNCASHAMLAMRARHGLRPPATTATWPPTGASVRKLTGDTSGGTTLQQNESALLKGYHIDTLVLYRESFDAWVNRVAAGQPSVLSGSYSVIAPTQFDANNSAFFGNHAIYVNEINAARTAALVYDPLADHRRSTVPQGPQWWPLSLLKSYAGRLVMDLRLGTTIGYGNVYASHLAVPDGPIADPVVAPVPTSTVVLKYGGIASGRGDWVVIANQTRMRSTPYIDSGHPTANVVQYLAAGTRFHNSQTTLSGTSVAGSRRWLGSADGNHWLHSSVVKSA